MAKASKQSKAMVTTSKQKENRSKALKTVQRAQNISDEDREKVVELLLEKNFTYNKTARELGLTVQQVRGVASTIKPELEKQKAAQREDIERLLQCGTRSALEKLIDAVENDQIPPDKLATAAGVLYDKWRDLAGSTSMIQALVVPGNNDVTGVANQVMGLLIRAQTRVGSSNDTEVND